MVNFEDIIGNEQNIEYLKEVINCQKVSHAYIFNGAPRSGKKMLAKVFAKSLVCESRKNTGEACNKCKSCLQAENGNHIDIKWLIPKKDTLISVEDVRTQINSDIVVKPYKSDYKIYIIEDANKLNPQAQNALLKTIEEPPKYAVLILLTSNISSILPTILSRCIKINMKTIEDSKIENYLIQKFNVDEKKAKFCAGFSMGNLGQAIDLSQNEYFNELKEDCLHFLKYIDEMNIYEIIDFLKSLTKYKMDIDEYLDFITIWYRDILMLKVTNNPNKIIYKDEYNYLLRKATNISYEGIENVLMAIDKAKIRLRANVNFDIAIELLLLTLKEN